MAENEDDDEERRRFQEDEETTKPERVVPLSEEDIEFLELALDAQQIASSLRQIVAERGGLSDVDRRILLLKTGRQLRAFSGDLAEAGLRIQRRANRRGAPNGSRG